MEKLIKRLTKRITDFRDARDWKKFHNPKDLALSLSLEAAELAEHFQWRREKDLDKYVKTHKKHIGQELSDVFYLVLLMSHDLNIDIVKAFEEKMKINEKKYPVEKAKGSIKKYTEL
jgi:NTP pyrophosphatase (non-canonical NTP hydrolase)